MAEVKGVAGLLRLSDAAAAAAHTVSGSVSLDSPLVVAQSTAAIGLPLHASIVIARTGVAAVTRMEQVDSQRSGRSLRASSLLTDRLILPTAEDPLRATGSHNAVEHPSVCVALC